MTHRTVIKLGPIATSTVLLSSPENRTSRVLYDRHGLVLTPAGAPVVINHDITRKVGRVLELAVWPDTDGDWLVARCDVTDPPEWLRRGTKASFEYATTWRWEHGGWEWIRSGLVTEVSILTPSTQPAEPRAQFVLLERSEIKQPGDLVLHGNGQVIRRPNIGTVLGVR
jgi:hypothetical protein